MQICRTPSYSKQIYLDFDVFAVEIVVAATVISQSCEFLSHSACCLGWLCVTPSAIKHRWDTCWLFHTSSAAIPAGPLLADTDGSGGGNLQTTLQTSYFTIGQNRGAGQVKFRLLQV